MDSDRCRLNDVLGKEEQPKLLLAVLNHDFVSVALGRKISDLGDERGGCGSALCVQYISQTWSLKTSPIRQ